MRNIIKNLEPEKFEELFYSSNSYCDIIHKLGLNLCGSQYLAVKRKIEALGLSPSHFDKTKYRKNAHNAVKRPLVDVLTIHSNWKSTYHLKERLIKENILKNECGECKLTTWRNKLISLQLDHINGIRSDNRIENLRLLCPNCHSQCPTYAGKNKHRKENGIRSTN